MAAPAVPVPALMDTLTLTPACDAGVPFPSRSWTWTVGPPGSAATLVMTAPIAAEAGWRPVTNARLHAVTVAVSTLDGSCLRSLAYGLS